MSVDQFERYDESRDGQPLAWDFNRRELNRALDALEELRTPMTGAYGGGGMQQSFDPDKELVVRIIGQVEEGTDQYYWQSVGQVGNGEVVDDGFASNSDAATCYEEDGNIYVPVDGTVITILRPADGGDYLTFSYQHEKILARLEDSKGPAYAWQQVYQQSAGGFVAGGVLAGTTTVNSAYPMNGQVGLPFGTIVELRRGYCAGYGVAAVSAQQFGGNGLPQIQLLSVINAAGGTFTLTFDNFPGGGNPQTTDVIDWDADATEIQDALQALSNVYPTLASGPQISVSGTNPFQVTILGPYGQPGVNFDLMIADCSVLDNTQIWLFDPLPMIANFVWGAPATQIGSTIEVPASLQDNFGNLIATDWCDVKMKVSDGQLDRSPSHTAIIRSAESPWGRITEGMGTATVDMRSFQGIYRITVTEHGDAVRWLGMCQTDNTQVPVKAGSDVLQLTFAANVGGSSGSGSAPGPSGGDLITCGGCISSKTYCLTWPNGFSSTDPGYREFTFQPSQLSVGGFVSCIWQPFLGFPPTLFYTAVGGTNGVITLAPSQWAILFTTLSGEATWYSGPIGCDAIGTYTISDSGSSQYPSTVSISSGPCGQTLPAITSISPASGPVAGGTTVTITGTHFTGAMGVHFGSLTTTTFIIDSDTQLRATSPAESLGTVDIAVSNANGISGESPADLFTYYGPGGPTITRVIPSSGALVGGTHVVITGTNFTGTTTVKFGSTAAISFTVNADTQITAISPAESAGMVNIEVTTPSGTSAHVSADLFTYVAGPTVTSISPIIGPYTGGTAVTITGTDFTSAINVTFGIVSSTSVTVDSSTQITATTPAEIVGTVDTVVTTPYGISATSSADWFTFSAVGIFLLDTFHDADGTLLTAHTMNVGPGWSMTVPTGNGSVSDPTILANRAIDLTASSAVLSYSDSGVSDVVVSIDFSPEKTFVSGVSGYTIGLMARWTDVSNRWFLVLANNGLNLYRWQANVLTPVLYVPAPILTANKLYTLTLICNGTSISGQLRGPDIPATSTGVYTSSFNQTATTCGIYFNRNGNASCKIDISKFEVTSFARLLDTFHDTNGTLLSAHTPNIGSTWNLDATAGSASDVAIQSNLATEMNSGATLLTVFATMNSSASDVVVSVSFSPTNASGYWVGAVGRWSDVDNNWYVELIGTTLYLNRTQASVGATVLSVAAPALTAGNVYTLSLVCAGTAIVGQLSGVGITTTSTGVYTSSFNQTATKCGIKFMRYDAGTFYKVNIQQFKVT